MYVFPNKKILHTGENTTVRYTYWDTLFNHLQSFLRDENDIQCDIQLMEHPNSYYMKLPTFEEIKHYNPQQNVGTNLKLYGYFQSYKYFEHNHKKIKEMLKIDTIKQVLFDSILQFANSKTFFENTISMHFRIGDYVKYPDFHILLSDNYYIDSIEHVLKKYQLNSEK
jgi:hypothetical protein